MKTGTPTTPATYVPKVTRMASPATSMEEITLRMKKLRMDDKGKEKASS